MRSDGAICAATPGHARRQRVIKRRTRCEHIWSALAVLVVAAPPIAVLVAPLGGAVKPLVRAPQSVQSASIGGVSVVDDAVLEDERAHTRFLACVCDQVCAGHGSTLGRPVWCRARARS